MSPSFMGRSGVPHSGQFSGICHSRSVPSRISTTAPRISGMTSPALRRTTVSPIMHALGLDHLLIVQGGLAHGGPATFTGSIIANGVARPVRPTPTTMSSSLVCTSSGGYLYAIAQRGARLVAPSSACSASSSTLTTMPSISCSTSWRCSPRSAMNAATSSTVSNTACAGRRAGPSSPAGRSTRLRVDGRVAATRRCRAGRARAGRGVPASARARSVDLVSRAAEGCRRRCCGRSRTRRSVGMASSALPRGLLLARRTRPAARAGARSARRNPPC